MRIDSADAERTHFDIRELFGLWGFERGDLGVRSSGVGRPVVQYDEQGDEDAKMDCYGRHYL